MSRVEPHSRGDVRALLVADPSTARPEVTPPVGGLGTLARPAYDADMSGWRSSLEGAFSKIVSLTIWPVPRYPELDETTIETSDPATGEPRWRVVGYVETEGALIIIAPNGRDTDFVHEARGTDGRMRAIYNGHWRDAHLRVTDLDPEVLIEQMPPPSRAVLRARATDPCVVEVVFNRPDPG